jgi:ABC-type sugar transport system ATPase subunit
MLELKAVSRVVGRDVVLDRADAVFVRDAPTVVLGLSGEGRKAFLRLLSGAARPQAGRITLDGAALKRSGRGHAVWISRNGVDPSSAPASKTIAWAGARGTGRKTSPAEVLRLASIVGLSGKLETRTRDLALDGRVRLAVACGLAARPALLLLDAPLADLAAEMRARLLADLPNMLADAGSIVVYAAADADEAAGVGDQMLVLDHGRVVQAGPADEVAAWPATLAVAQATAFPGLNVLPASLVGGRLRLDDGASLEPPAGVSLPETGRCTLAFRVTDASFERPTTEAVRFVARVEGEKRIGGRDFTRLSFARTGWLAPAPQIAPEPGMVRGVYVAGEKLMVFDADGAAFGVAPMS